MKPDRPRPPLRDPNCGRTPVELAEYHPSCTRRPMSPDDYVWTHEATINRLNGHFLCNACYITAGMPTKHSRHWVCP